MIFFMAQLTQQTPRMPNTLPAIGQVKIHKQKVYLIIMLLVFCRIDGDYINFNADDNYKLKTMAH